MLLIGVNGYKLTVPCKLSKDKICKNISFPIISISEKLTWQNFFPSSSLSNRLIIQKPWKEKLVLSLYNLQN